LAKKHLLGSRKRRIAALKTPCKLKNGDFLKNMRESLTNVFSFTRKFFNTQLFVLLRP
jgi:hypothetical protein